MLKNSKKSFKTRLSSTQSKFKTKAEFFELLIKASSSNPTLELRIPETLIKFSLSNTTCMIFTNDEGYLFSKMNVKSSYEHRFMKRCYYFQRQNSPVTVAKVYLNGLESIRCIMDIKETYNIWKKGINNICIIQRFIYPFNSTPLRARVEFSVSDASFSKRLTRHPVNIFLNSQPHCEKFLALGDLGEESKSVEENLQSQMQTLKKIIETEENRNQVVSFIVADFIQDFEENWFFISLISYKYETLLPKIINMKKNRNRRVNKSEKSLKNEKINKSLNFSSTLKDILTQEALRDLSIN